MGSTARANEKGASPPRSHQLRKWPPLAQRLRYESRLSASVVDICRDDADGPHVAQARHMSHRTPQQWVVVACALVVFASCASQHRSQPAQETQFAQAVSAPNRLRPPDQLSETARAILKTHMAFHARDMGALMSEIMVLRYDEIREGAQRIVGDASLSRPLSDDASELNSALPEKFFLYQDNLRLESKTLAEAAGRHNPFDVADSYGRLSQVCVRCHATYRAGR
jgi:cytochrome c556